MVDQPASPVLVYVAHAPKTAVLAAFKENMCTMLLIYMSSQHEQETAAAITTILAAA